MRTYLLIISAFCVLGLMLAGCQTENKEDEQTPVKESEQAQQNTTVSINVTGEEDLAEGSEMSDSANGTVDENDNSPQYKAYSGSEYTALKGSKPFVLFFHADWCPICRQMEKTYTERLDEFPEGTIILKTDYDTEDELKSEYGVTTQSTVIVFDAEGERIYAAQDPRLDDFMAAIRTSLELT